MSPPGERLGRADREPADLLRRRDVAVEQRRREVADRHVVEAVAGLVGRQQRRDVDVERQQVADGVLVLGSRQPPDASRCGRDSDAHAAARSSDVSRDATTAS